MKVLLLEDEIGIRSFVSLNLKREGYEVFEATSGEEALEVLKGRKIDIALLDVMLPGISGFEVCKHIRKNYGHIRVIMVTAKGMESDKIIGLTYGADDYVVKPFSVKELMARVNVLKRRIEEISVDKKEDTVILSGPYKMDTKQRKFLRDENEVELTPTEFSIIKFLLNNRGEAMSRNDILDHVWGKDYVGDYKIVDVNVRRIRSKIESDPSHPEYLTTVWGFGYCWRKED